MIYPPKPREYILKKSGFFGLDLDIDENVLIPRPETEILVEQVLTHMKKINRCLRVLEIGTGSGNIAVSLGLESSARIFSLDLSFNALKVAAKNISKYKLAKVFLINADLLSCFKRGSFDIIVANPPYVETAYLENEESLQVEPMLALDGGKDGLRVIRRILDAAPGCLKKEGLLFLEIGYNQREAIEEYSRIKGWNLVSCVNDYAGIERVMIWKN